MSLAGKEEDTLLGKKYGGTRLAPRVIVGQTLLNLTLVVLLILMLIPASLLLILAGKTADQYEAHPWTITFPYHWEHFPMILPGLLRNMWNTAIISLSAIAIAITVSSYTAFVFARFSFPGKEVLYYLIIGLMMIPGVLSLVPGYVLVLKLGLLGSRWACILPYAAGACIFGTFLLRPFMSSLPEELFESARIDGASEWQSYYRIAVPLSVPILTTLIILWVMGHWNDYIWPALVLRTKYHTVTLGVWSLARSEMQRTQWGMIFAGFTVSALPMVLLFFATRNAFIRGLSTGALKL